MKFEIDRKRLIEAAAIAAKSAGQKTVRPILANVLITAKDDTIQFVGTDLESMIMLSVPADVEKEGATTVSAKLFVEMCAGLPSDSLFPVEVESTDSQLIIGCDKVKFQLLTMDSDDFPPVPDLSTLEMAEIKGTILALAMRQAGIAADLDSGINPVQKAVYVDLIHKPIAASTDSKRLAVVKINDFDVPESMKQGWIIPVKAVKELSEMLKNANVAEMAVYKNQLVCRVGGVTYTVRTIDGKWPDYTRVLPKASTSSITVSRKALAQALKSLLPIARNNSNTVAYEFTADSLSLSANAPENGSAETKIDCKVTGEPPNICLNLQFVTDFLGSVDADDVQMDMTTADYPILFSANNGDQRCVCMPMSA